LGERKDIPEDLVPEQDEENEGEPANQVHMNTAIKTEVVMVLELVVVAVVVLVV